MITEKTLRKLTDQRLEDADVLIANERYDTAVYIAGYALEIALKLKICRIFNFTQGFPENRHEFAVYQNSEKSQMLLVSAITQIRNIRNHNLNKLLFFSGAEYRVKLNFLTEWSLAAVWHPEMRYEDAKISKKGAKERVAAVKTLVQNI